MSDNYHRPTLTFPNGLYNATQVRLYGVWQDYRVLPKEKCTPEYEKAMNKVNDLIDEAIKEEVSCDADSPSETSSSFIQIDTKTPGQHVRIYSFGGTKCKPISCGIIVGYSFEGHCYDLPKPKIMFIPAAPREIPVDDCGYDIKYDKAKEKETRDKYRLWIVDKLDECIEFEMNQGFVEQLVLDANLPGKRSPTMYASRMMMSHRSGKLGE